MTPRERLSEIAAHFTELQTFNGRPFRKSGQSSIWRLEETFVCVRFRNSKWSTQPELLVLCDLLIGSRCVHEYRKRIEARMRIQDFHQYGTHISEAGRSGQSEWVVDDGNSFESVTGGIASRFSDMISAELRPCLTNAGLLAGNQQASVWPNASLQRVVDIGIIALRVHDHDAAAMVIERLTKYDDDRLGSDPAARCVLEELREFVCT